jgi:hypothetical protein
MMGIVSKDPYKDHRWDVHVEFNFTFRSSQGRSIDLSWPSLRQ